VLGHRTFPVDPGMVNICTKTQCGMTSYKVSPVPAGLPVCLQWLLTSVACVYKFIQWSDIPNSSMNGLQYHWCSAILGLLGRTWLKFQLGHRLSFLCPSWIIL